MTMVLVKRALVACVVLLLDFGQCQVNSQEFIYVPKGRDPSEGVTLRETPQNDLPPGKYEIVAAFDEPNVRPPRYVIPEQSPYSLQGRKAQEDAASPFQPQSGYKHLVSEHAHAEAGRSPFELPSHGYNPKYAESLETSTSDAASVHPVISVSEGGEGSPFQLPPSGYTPKNLVTASLEPPTREYLRPSSKFENFPSRFEDSHSQERENSAVANGGGPRALALSANRGYLESERTPYDDDTTSEEISPHYSHLQQQQVGTGKTYKSAEKEYNLNLYLRPERDEALAHHRGAAYEKIEDLTYRKNDHRYESHDQQRRPLHEPRRDHFSHEPDHWSGYDPELSRRKFEPAASSQNSFDEEQLFVTPLPLKKKSQIKRKIQKDHDDAENELKRLQEIAVSKPKTAPDFVCPRDGHYGDKNDCAKFYRCAHGTALVEFCPGGLFWNAVNDQCDWPETVDCTYNSVTMDNYKVKQPTTLFMTFDDGPNEGTDAILKALRKEGVRATFFINSRNFRDPNPLVVEKNVNSIIAMIKEGHVVADHSYDHMFHNSKNSPKDAFQDVEEDLKYFGVMNIYPILDILWKADMKDLIGPVNHTMAYYVRIPYTNNWRVGKEHRDCYECTIPASSGQKGVEITNVLHKEGKQIIGWDLEWEIDWSKNRFKYGGKEMFFRMARDERLLKPKMVILSHDIAHREHEARDEQKELETFLELAKKSGYKFDTVDNYME